MKITVLGCGSSGGVPVAGGLSSNGQQHPDGDWGACNPENPRNRRRRASILVEDRGTTVLVDTTPDLREQLLSVGVRRLDAVFYTHAHADHCHGIDDLRGINMFMGEAIPAYCDKETLDDIGAKFAYAFRPPSAEKRFYRPCLVPNVVDMDGGGEFKVGEICVKAFVQDHGPVRSLGFRFGDFAYSTDVHGLDARAFAALKGIKAWVVDCMREKPHPTHSHTAQTLEWIARAAPERAWLTHMDQSMDYDDLARRLPRGVEPAYDGLVIEV